MKTIGRPPENCAGLGEAAPPALAGARQLAELDLRFG
jgi:hypothetical protein